MHPILDQGYRRLEVGKIILDLVVQKLPDLGLALQQIEAVYAPVVQEMSVLSPVLGFAVAIEKDQVVAVLKEAKSNDDYWIVQLNNELSVHKFSEINRFQKT
jgi:hypothetical protein